MTAPVSAAVSQSALGRMLGVSETAVRKAVARGRIRRRPDGLIDAEEALRDWHKNSVALRHVGMEWLQEQIEFPPLDDDDGSQDRSSPERGKPTIAELQRANLALKAQKQKLELDARRGELVERAKAERVVFEFGRRVRDAWVLWPARVAAGLAAQFGADPHAVETALAAEVRKHLEELSRDPPPEFDAR